MKDDVWYSGSRTAGFLTRAAGAMSLTAIYGVLTPIPFTLAGYDYRLLT